MTAMVCAERMAPKEIKSTLAGTQGLTLVHFSAQLEPCLTHRNTLHTPNTPLHPLNMGYTNPTQTLSHKKRSS
jgi:hypothetical protein